MKAKTGSTLLLGDSLSRRVFVIFNYVLLTLMTITSIFPIWHTLAVSLSASAAVEGGLVSIVPIQFTLEHYQSILKNANFYTAFFISMKRVLVAVPFSLLCIILIAYPLSKEDKNFHGRKIYVWFFIITMLFNGGLVPTYIIIKSTGLTDTIWALILPCAVSVFNMLILMNFFRELPKELEESALIDGAGHFTILFKIFLPLAKPALATLTLFVFVFHWNSWFDGLLYINSNEKIPLQTYLQTLLTMPDTDKLTIEEMTILGRMSRRATNAAQIVISTSVIFIIYPFLQKYYTKGLVLGSVKG